EIPIRMLAIEFAQHGSIPAHYTNWLIFVRRQRTLNGMAEERLDSVFHALADRTRRAMLRTLAAGEHNIGALAAPHRMSFAAASKHVKVLEKAGLVQRRIQGRSHICRIEAAPLATAEE